jgi:hypothetical protein
MNRLDINMDGLDLSHRITVQKYVDEYFNAHDKLNSVINASQNAFDTYRLTFPNDFNFDAFLTQNNPEYHEALDTRNNARNKLNTILNEYFNDWDKNALL